MTVEQKFTPQDYVDNFQNRTQKVILVEGKTDKQLLSLLLDEFNQQYPDHNFDEIAIDTAQDLVKGVLDSPENYQKIEEVCELIADKPYASRFVGLVDRMFRGFDLSDPLTDGLTQHRVDKRRRLVWSRGHSIENYLFDPEILREAFRAISDFDGFQMALNRFIGDYSRVMQVGCAISLGAERLNRFGAVRSGLQFVPTDNDLPDIIQFAEWQKMLRSRNNWTDAQFDALLDQLDLWLPLVEQTDLTLLQRLCDGHSGVTLLCQVYRNQVKGNSPNEKVLRFFDKLPPERITQLLGSVWARRAVAQQADYPAPLIGLLAD